MSESKIQSKIKLLFKKSGYKVLKIIQLSENGFPDLLCMKNGKSIWIEVKDKGEKPSKLQLYRLKQLKENGFDAYWTDSYKYLIDVNFNKINIELC